MINNGGHHFDVAVLLTRTGIGPAGEKNSFILFDTCFSNLFDCFRNCIICVDLFSLFCLSELKLCQLTNTEVLNKRIWDYLKLSLFEDRCENCNDPYDFALNSFQ